MGLAGLAWALHRHGGTAVRWHARWLTALLLLQVATGTANVVLSWPLLGALCHTAGAAALVAVLVSLVAPKPTHAPRATG
jgi:cytochrome c oxidase assembly protein subunit 15